MKSSQILVSALFGAFAAAVPFKRDLVTKTEVVFQTVVVYTTVWDDEAPAAEATTTAAAYSYTLPASSEAETTPAASYTPSASQNSSSVYTAPVQTSASYTPSASQNSSSVYTAPVQTSASYTPSASQNSSSVYTAPVQTSAAPVSSSTVVVVSSAAPAPEASSAAPAAPTTTEAAYTPASVASSSAPAATSAVTAPATQQQSADTTSSTGTYSGDLTINPLTGALGACGKPLYATDMVVALASDTWGTSTYDVMTGASTNPWCGKKINIEYNGKTVAATIMDMCPGCSGSDIDLSDAAWAAIGMTEWTRVQGSWSVAE